jgi:hypothetical protein
MDRRAGNKWKEWFFLPTSDRAEYIKSKRGGGSVPPDYIEALEDAVREGRLELAVKSVRGTTPIREGILVEFSDGSTFVASQVVLGTGSTHDSLKLPLIASIAARFGLPFCNGLPLLSQDLQWQDGISVVGALAAGELGPDAGNLSGARRAAAICAESIGVFDHMQNGGSILSNLFSALASDSDLEEEEEEEEEEEDSLGNVGEDMAGETILFGRGAGWREDEDEEETETVTTDGSDASICVCLERCVGECELDMEQDWFGDLPPKP